MGCSQLPFSTPTIKVQTNEALLLREKEKNTLQNSLAPKVEKCCIAQPAWNSSVSGIM